MNFEQNDIIAFRDILGVLRRQIRLLVLSALLILGLALVYVLNTTPVFTATTMIYVDTRDKDLLDTSAGSRMNSSAENSRIESEVLILRSPKIAIETIRRADLLATDDYRPQLSFADKARLAVGLDVDTATDASRLLANALEKLAANTAVERQGLTYVISVSADSQHPQNAAVVANAMAKAYIDLQVQSKADAVLASRDVIEAQIASAHANLALTEARLDGFFEDNLARLETEIGTAKFGELAAAFQDARAHVSSTRAAISEVRTAVETGNIDDVVDQLEDAALEALAQQRHQVLAGLGALEQGSPQSVNLRASLDDIEAQLNAQAEASIGRLEQDVSNLSEIQASLQGEIRREVIASRLSAETLAQIYTLQQESSIAQRQYGTLISRLRDLEAQALVQVADSRIVSEALPPRAPSRPNTSLILALAGVLSIGVGVCSAFVTEFLVGGVTSRKQLENLVPAPVGALIPKARAPEPYLGVADLVVEAQLSPFAEAVRRLRASIDHPSRTANGACSVIMVTSSTSAEGKSSVSLALARTYALAGKRVLLIDADLRNPMLHKLVGFQPQKGFLDYLKEPTALFEDDKGFYISDPKSDVGIILGNGRADSPTDQLLQSVAFERLIEESREVMDVVVIDTSPLGGVVDARYIAPRADCVVHVVRFGMTQQKNLREAYNDLSASVREATPIYTVLNFDDVDAKGYGYSSGYTS